MSFTFTSFRALLVPFIVIFGLVGLRRGIWREIGITFGMGVVVLATVLFPGSLIGFINRIIINIPRVFGLLLNRSGVQALPADLLFGDLGATAGNVRFFIARIVLFLLLTFLVYSRRFGWAYDIGPQGFKPRIATSRSQNLLGGVFGGITGFLWFIALNDFLNALRGLRNTDRIPPEGTTINVPTVTDISPLIAFVPTLVVILLLVLLVLALLRLPRLWR